MNDDDLDALAAEYVLGTLASDERAHAEALIGIDPGFVETRAPMGAPARRTQCHGRGGRAAGGGLGEDQGGGRHSPRRARKSARRRRSRRRRRLRRRPPRGRGEARGRVRRRCRIAKLETSPILSALESDLLSPQGEAEAEKPKRRRKGRLADLRCKPPSPLVPPRSERGADMFYLAHRMRRWRSVALGCGALAAVLAAFIVVTQVAPGLIPAGLIRVPQLIAQSPPAPSAAAPGSRLVAVLQQQPSSPAFLLIVDPASRSLTVRRVSAKAQAGHSYELWLIASSTAKPLSLGVVGAGEYTQRALAGRISTTERCGRRATRSPSSRPAARRPARRRARSCSPASCVESVAPAPAPTPKT